MRGGKKKLSKRRKKKKKKKRGYILLNDQNNNTIEILLESVMSWSIPVNMQWELLRESREVRNGRGTYIIYDLEKDKTKKKDAIITHTFPQAEEKSLTNRQNVFRVLDLRRFSFLKKKKKKKTIHEQATRNTQRATTQTEVSTKSDHRTNDVHKPGKHL